MVELTRWPTATRPPLGRVVEVLGSIDAPGVDTQIIIRKHGIPDVHGDEAMEEARRIGGAVRERDVRGRTDFRPQQTVTIDGEHARDFDDAITIDALPNGHYRLGVHIADVSHYVEEGSALDLEAYRARHVGVLSRAGGAHVPFGARDRALLAQPARGPARPVVRDGGVARRRGRAGRVPRWRHQQ